MDEKSPVSVQRNAGYMTFENVHERRRWYGLILLCAAQFIVVLDGSVINVAMPTIGQAFGADQQALTWVVSAYVLAFGGFLLLGGRLADLLGRRRMFVVGLVLFGVASLVGGFAGSIEVLIATRVAQGLGAAILSPAAMSIISVTFHDGIERNKAYAAWGAVGGAGGAAGVVLGGVLTQYAGWQWVLWINVPIVACCLLLVVPLLAERRTDISDRVFDFAGATTVTAALTLLVYTLIEAPAWGWGSIRTIGSGAGVVVLFAAFVIVERRSREPLVDLTIFRIRSLTGANLAGAVAGGLVVPMFFFLSLYLQNVLRYDAITTGLCLVPMCVVTFGISLTLGSTLVTKWGYQPVLATGMALLGVGLAWFGRAASDGSFAVDVLAPGLVAGAGLGLVFTPLFVAAATGVDWRRAGLASGLINTSQQIGGALGLAVLSSVTFARLEEGNVATAETLTDGYTAAFDGAAVVAGIGLLVTVTVIRARDSRAHVELTRRSRTTIPTPATKPREPVS
ncbi:MFS transporter [Micromonospora sp. KC723]|uniref:MFS transporter n=1 Tax=Micromonospora sp. KC723 TaxID=2530381 RepID=UPI001A9F84F4|nr:MFS transporter [Micromonospora sp. KC723]